MRSAEETRRLVQDRVLGHRAPRRGVLNSQAYSPRQATIPLHQIQPAAQQPRKAFDPEAQAELKESIRAQGLLGPILLRQLAADRYVIVAGERRFRAFMELSEEPAREGHNPTNFKQIPALIREDRGEDAEADAQLSALVENVIRVDLSPAERATAFRDLHQLYGWTFEEIAGKAGMTIGMVQEYASVGKVPAVAGAVASGRLTVQKGLALSRVGDPEVAEGLIEAAAGSSVQQTKEMAKAARALPRSMPVAERVEAVVKATGRPQVLPQGPTFQREVPTSGGGAIAIDMVRPAQLPLGPVHRQREISRQGYAEAMQATCEALDIWPVKPRRAKQG